MKCLSQMTSLYKDPKGEKIFVDNEKSFTELPSNPSTATQPSERGKMATLERRIIELERLLQENGVCCSTTANTVLSNQLNSKY